MGDDETTAADARPMTGAEYRCVTYGLGLSRDSLARLLGMSPRAAERMLYGARPVPPGIAADVRAWQARADAELALMRAACDSDPGHIVITYGDDDAYRADHPGDRMPAAWHRAIVTRLLWERPGTRVEYAP